MADQVEGVTSPLGVVSGEDNSGKIGEPVDTDWYEGVDLEWEEYGVGLQLKFAKTNWPDSEVRVVTDDRGRRELVVYTGLAIDPDEPVYVYSMNTDDED